MVQEFPQLSPLPPWPIPAAGSRDQETSAVPQAPGSVYMRVYEPEEIGALRSEIAKLRADVAELKDTLARKSSLMVIQNLDSTRLQLRIPLAVTIECDSRGACVVWSEDLNTYGAGGSEEEAKRDFLKNIEELYFDLKQDKDVLGPALAKIWKHLERVIEETQIIT